MPIVCGTDLSEHGEVAVRAALAIARRLAEPLHVVHAVDLGAHTVYGYAREPVLSAARERVEAAVATLAHGGDVTAHVLEGAPDEALAAHADAVAATLVVVAAGTRRSTMKRLLGSTADRIVQACTAPVLVVRAAEPFEAWARSERPLRVLVGLDLSESSDAAVRWTRAFMKQGGCEVVAAHSYGEFIERFRFGLPADAAPPDLEKLIARDLGARLRSLGVGAAVQLVVSHSSLRVADHLADLARAHAADVVVVGSHHRPGPRASLATTVSQRVLRLADAAVASVPAEPARAHAFPPVPRVRSVLVPTDLGEGTARALALAYALVERGGTVHLVHVVDAGTHGPVEESPDAPWRGELLRRLRALVPADAGARDVRTLVELESGRDIAVAICQAAERLGDALVCLAAKARPGVRRMLAGSVTQEVLARSRRPVLVVPPEGD